MLSFILSTHRIEVNAIPQGATITYNYTEDATIRSPASHTAAGGSFTTLTLNVSSQTSKWKAYVGNVTGKITLDNANNMTIYDWVLTTMQGEVYAARNTITFSSLTCANRTNITTEDAALNINSSSEDSINKTFTQQKHQSFVIGGAGTISNSTCYSVATYINDTQQTPAENATFQEMLLSDGASLVFVTLLNDNKAGFDLGTYDFQLILPDDPTDTSTAYYFYAELG
ncbi:hypothetical protein JW756_05830 [Candidatus Woesearchaeota archaeon]|nr:hypothetical protein [Candidatus Woesearchaeota archaeon]